MPSGRKRFIAGRGCCGSCNGVYAIRSLNNRILMGSHSSLQDASDKTKAQHERLRERWSRYANIGDLPRLRQYANSTWGGEVDQQITVVENPVGSRSTRGSGFEVWDSPVPLRTEVRSGTHDPLSNSWIFNINGHQFAFPYQTITLQTQQLIQSFTSASIAVSQTAQMYQLTWNQWANSANNAGMGRGSFYTAPIEDPAVVEERQRRAAEELFRRTEAARVANEEAIRRATGTLLSLLTPEQRAEYERKKFFHVRGSEGRLYRILHGSSGNIREVRSEAEEGRGLHAYCVHPRMYIPSEEGGGSLPHEDAMIAQLLGLQTDEQGFLAIANRHW